MTDTRTAGLAGLQRATVETAREPVRVARDAEIVEVMERGTRARVRLLAPEVRSVPGDGVIEIDHPASSPPLRVALVSMGGRYLAAALAVGDRVLVLSRDRVPGTRMRWQPAHDVVIPCVDLTSAQVREDGAIVVGMPTGEAAHFGTPAADRLAAVADNTAARLKRLEDAFAVHGHDITTAVSGSANLMSGVVTGSGTGTTGAPTNAASVSPRTVEADVGTTRIKVDA